MPPDSHPATASYNRLREYMIGILGAEAWPDDLNWRMYQVKHGLLHALERTGYPVKEVPNYDEFVSFQFVAGMAMGVALANKDLDTILDDLPKPSKDCEWPWTFQEWLVVANQVRASNAAEGRPSGDAPRFD